MYNQQYLSKESRTCVSNMGIPQRKVEPEPSSTAKGEHARKTQAFAQGLIDGDMLNLIYIL